MTTEDTESISDRFECPECGSSQVSERLRTQVFQYGTGSDPVTLSADVPILRCMNCGIEFTDFRGERARHEAVCRHQGVLTPRQIVAIREALGLTRSEFAALGGFGIASVQRWETGTLIQNSSSDRLIFLLQFTANRTRLIRRNEVKRDGSIDLSAVAVDAVQVECAPEISVSTLSVFALAADESLRRSSAIFAALMNDGAMFQQV